MGFIGQWIIFYLGIMFAMTVDNIFWIPTSPEYKEFKKLPWIIPNAEHIWLKMNNWNFYYTKIGYILGYRVKTVLTHWRDIVPAIITSLILTIIF